MPISYRVFTVNSVWHMYQLEIVLNNLRIANVWFFLLLFVIITRFYIHEYVIDLVFLIEAFQRQ